ncbi:MAG: CDP-2,3-bis-(O-geranylgeranyl)-sn-glycerol synthase [Candidatus Thorarchaeota archaeon]|nr:CDP-2,3-bis-(O-geranylgeranyl)-sn-glycerol synthase [Candidatus Thorarchaeota archaeon]
MYETIALIELAIWLGLPAWIANSMPVLFGGGRPIDNGRVFRDGRRILGDGKTIRGFVVGVFLGTMTGIGQSIAAPYLKPLLENYVVVTPSMEHVLYMSIPAAFLLSLGALTGDVIGSFLKRRIDIKSGNPSLVLDQLGFILVGLILASPILQPDAVYVIILVVTTLGIHWISNAVGYLLGLKKNPW